jgi:hypothetical protein
LEPAAPARTPLLARRAPVLSDHSHFFLTLPAVGGKPRWRAKRLVRQRAYQRWRAASRVRRERVASMLRLPGEERARPASMPATIRQLIPSHAFLSSCPS